jgi:hypothetical protein
MTCLVNLFFLLTVPQFSILATSFIILRRLGGRIPGSKQHRQSFVRSLIIHMHLWMLIAKPIQQMRYEKVFFLQAYHFNTISSPRLHRLQIYLTTYLLSQPRQNQSYATNSSATSAPTPSKLRTSSSGGIKGEEHIHAFIAWRWIT